jgi:predicted alpha/beta superfamily hydrolase
MKYLIHLVLGILVCNAAIAQFTLKLIVNDVATKKQDDVYVAGSFNNWNTRDEKFKLKPYGTSRKALILKDMPAGNYEFKFTRGTDKWETTAKGEDLPNRVVVLNDDVTENFSIAGWKDDFPEKPKMNTATAQVKIIDTAFNMPELNRKRRIWAYLPKGYETSKKSYPVIYMHDGQNLFNEQTAPFGEWGIDEALDTLMRQTGKEAIIIGIDHGGDKRLKEYSPYDHKQYGKGEGDQYVDFLALTLKPFIDKKYRTLKDSTNTFIAGSSMGGLISLYAMVKHPNVFGGAGIFSPAFWITPSLYDAVQKAKWNGHVRKFYFYAGGNESGTMVPDMEKMLRVVESKGNYKTRRVIDPLGKHNEPKWRNEFPDFYRFIMQ